MKNYPNHCRWSTSELTDRGLYFMKVIEQNNLQKAVTDMCPDVCEHWLEVVNQEVKELKMLLIESALTNTPAENKNKLNCDMSGQEPPKNYESWKSCQKPITC